MPDTVTANEQLSGKLQEDFFGESTPAPATEPTTAAPPTEAAPATNTQGEPTTPAAETSAIDYNSWLKKEFEIEDVDSLKNQLNEYKELKEKGGKGFQFKNDDSRIIAEYINEGKEDELFNLLQNRMSVKRLSAADVNDKKNAEALVKLSIKNENPNLTDEDVDFVFNEKYAIPRKPSQKIDQTDEEYEIELEEWGEKAKAIERRLNIEAKMAQPKIAKLLSELKLPDIKGGNAQLTAEDAAALKQMQETFLEKSAASINNFSGFTAQVKDKDVDYSVSYSPSADERKLVSDAVQQLANANFDANAIFAARWVNEDNTLNEAQMTEDLSRLFMGKNSDAKIANEAANQRLELFLKGKKNVNVTGGVSGGAIPAGKSNSQYLQEQFWGS